MVHYRIKITFLLALNHTRIGSTNQINHIHDIELILSLVLPPSLCVFFMLEHSVEKLDGYGLVD